MSRRLAINLVLSLVVAALFLYLAFRNVPLGDLGVALGRFDLRWLVPALAISLTLQVFRAWRWQLELRPLERISLGRLWIVTSVAYMAINVLPARLGEFVRPWLLSRRSGVTFPNVVGNLVVEKTMDSMVIVFYILVGLLTTSNLPAWVRRGAIFPAIAAAVIVALVALLWTKGEPFVDRWVVGRLPARFGTGLKRVTRALLDGMKILPDGKLVSTVFLVSLALWFLPILSSYVIIRAFGFDVPFNAALIVFIFIGFGTALPNAPGMIGTYQYACVLALGLFGVDQTAALAYGLVLNAIQLVSLVAQGLVALPLAGVGLADLRRARRELPAEA
ncbi:MAG TPA: lysylphosphatidylglycerol synthase transmembrane domain-containing protein [Candidatus Acidoferrales bacterium]|nr:lysylphosphatidylglycerol synthase transmembrane domain-containing protein [Candidatus Acidoferrales bacterium]